MENYVESLDYGWIWKKEQPIDIGDDHQDIYEEQIKYCSNEHSITFNN